MKRAILLFLLGCVSAWATHALYYSVARPDGSAEECSMEWLAASLELTPAQSAAVWAIHQRRCPEICRLNLERAACVAEDVPSAAAACQGATEQLIIEVSAQLTPAQREKYLRLVAPCLRAPLASP